MLPSLRSRSPTISSISRNGPEPVEWQSRYPSDLEINGLDIAPELNEASKGKQRINPPTMAVFVYILRLKSGGLYVGACYDVERRYREYCSGKASRMTRVDPPTAVVYKEECETLSEARRRESQMKRWSRAKKEALIQGDFTRLKELSKSRSR